VSAPRIVVVGSANTDLVVKLPRLPGHGETMLGGEFAIAPGGKGANQAVAAARLGAQTTFIGCLGGDQFGDDVLAAIEGAGVDTRFICRADAIHTGVGLIMVGPDGENMIGVASGANHQLFPEHLEAAAEAFAGADIVLSQLEIPDATIRRSADLATAHGARFLLNPAPAAPLPGDLLTQVAVLVPNRVELAFHSGMPVETLEEVTAAAGTLLARGAGAVVTTLGPDGALALDADGAAHIPAPLVDAVDATAAGDTFCGALAVMLAEGRDLREAVRYAVTAASLAVTKLGAIPSIPTRDEVERFLHRPTASSAPASA